MMNTYTRVALAAELIFSAVHTGLLLTIIFLIVSHPAVVSDPGVYLV